MGALGVVVWLLLCAYGAWLYVRHHCLRHKLRGLPSPRSLPILGHSSIIKPDPEGFGDQVMGMAELYSFPRMTLFWLGPFPALMIYSAKLLESIISSSRHLNKGFAYDLLHPWLGISLLTSESSMWRPRRKLLTPTFHYDILKDFVPIFNEQSRILIDKLKKVPTGKATEISKYITLCTLEIICETSMGSSVNAQTEEDSQYVRAIYRINSVIQERIKNPLMYNNTIFNKFGEGEVHDECLRILHGFTRSVIEERERDLEKRDWQLGERLAFLDLLLHMMHNGQLAREDIQPEVDTFMFEGHDTTSTALTWVLHLIGNDPDVLRRCQSEVDEVMTGEELSIEELGRLKYLEAAIKEALRLYPSVPIIMRELGDNELIGNTVVPKGTPLLINQYLIHRDPEYWPNPELYNPDRFLSDSSKRHPFSFVPFSAGSRNCIGQRFALLEEKTILAYILRHFDVHSVEKRYEVRSKIDLIIRPADGIFVRLFPRTN